MFLQSYLSILPSLIPLYIVIAFGFALGKTGKIDLKDIAGFLIMVVNPVVAFGAMLLTPLQLKFVALPFLVFVLCCLIALVSYFVGAKLLKMSNANLLGLSAGTASTGYFGIPIAMMLLAPDALALYIVISLSTLVFEATLGYYLGSQKKSRAKTIKKTTAEIFREMARIPLVYAVVLGLLVNLANITVPAQAVYLYDMFKMVLIVLGMTVVGIAMSKFNLSDIRFRKPTTSKKSKKQKTDSVVDLKFLFSALIVKHLVWPLAIFGLVVLDHKILNFYPPSVYFILIILSIVPLAANTVSYAAKLDLQPQQAAFAVFVSNILSFFLIPLSLILMTS